MNCRKYRACLMGVIAVAIVVGVLIFVKNVRENEVPAEGTLVENCGDGEKNGHSRDKSSIQDSRDGVQAWA